MTTINRKQPMRPAEIDLLNQVDTNTADIATQTARLTQEIADRTHADNVLQSNIDAESKTRADADTTLQNNIDTEKSERKTADTTLQQAIQDQLTFLQSVPAQEFGTSNMIDVQANSSTSIDINFGSAKKEAPIVLCSLRHTSGNLACIVTGITNQKFSVTVYNLSSVAASGVTVDWLAISGR